MEEKVTTKHVQNMHKRSISLQLPPLSEYNSNKMCSPEFPLGIIPEIISLRFYCIPLRHFTLKHHLGLAQKRALVWARRKKFSLKPQSLSSVIFLPIFNLHFFTFSSTPWSRTMSIFFLKSYLSFFEFQNIKLSTWPPEESENIFSLKFDPAMSRMELSWKYA